MTQNPRKEDPYRKGAVEDLVHSADRQPHDDRKIRRNKRDKCEREDAREMFAFDDLDG